MIKKGIKENEPLNSILEKMVSDGMGEDEALDIMIRAWLFRMSGGE